MKIIKYHQYHHITKNKIFILFFIFICGFKSNGQIVVNKNYDTSLTKFFLKDASLKYYQDFINSTNKNLSILVIQNANLPSIHSCLIETISTDKANVEVFNNDKFLLKKRLSISKKTTDSLILDLKKLDNYELSNETLSQNLYTLFIIIKNGNKFLQIKTDNYSVLNLQSSVSSYQDYLKKIIDLISRIKSMKILSEFDG